MPEKSADQDPAEANTADSEAAASDTAEADAAEADTAESDTAESDTAEGPVTESAKEIFAAALEKKKAAGQARSAHLDGHGGVGGATASHKATRTFRRKSG